MGQHTLLFVDSQPKPPPLSYASSPLQIDSLAHKGQVRHGPAQLIVDRLGESGGGCGFAMHDVGMLRRRVKAAQPFEQPRLIGMRRKAAHGVDRGSDRNGLAEDVSQARRRPAGGLASGQAPPSVHQWLCETAPRRMDPLSNRSRASC